MLGVHDDLIGDEVSGVESDTELSDHAEISARLDRFHESLRAGLGDRSEVEILRVLKRTACAIVLGVSRREASHFDTRRTRRNTH